MLSRFPPGPIHQQGAGRSPLVNHTFFLDEKILKGHQPMQIVNLKLEDIHPYPNNPRLNDEAVASLA